MSGEYLTHYNAKGGAQGFFTPGFSSPLLAPACKIRGRKDTTDVAENVTCTKCRRVAKLDA